MSDPDPTTTPAGNSRGPLLLVLGAALLALVGFAALTGGESETESPALDEIVFATADGGTMTLAEHAGTPVVLNFFASWCSPCRDELPDFEAVHLAMGDDVTIIGVSRDASRSAWLSLVEETGITFETVFEGAVEGAFAELRAVNMPTTAFITADGEVVHTSAGALSETQLRSLIETHLL